MRGFGRVIVLLGAVMGVAMTMVAAVSGTSAAAQRAVTLQTAAEAWYWTAGCITPLGCSSAAPPTDPYPPDTLHVGRLGPDTVTSSYISLNAAQVPTAARIIAATLVLPVATDNGAGTVNPAAASIQICLTERPVVSKDYGTANPPATDCTRAARAVYHARGHPRFTANILPLVRSAGTLEGTGFAILPTSQTGAWQVAFNGRNRRQPGQPPIAAVVGYATTAPMTGTVSRPTPTPGGAGHQTASGEGNLAYATPPQPPPVAGSQGRGVPPEGQRPVVASTPSSSVIAVAPTATSVLIRGGRYGMVWAVPIGLLLLGWLVSSTATRDLRGLAGGHGPRRT